VTVGPGVTPAVLGNNGAYDPSFLQSAYNAPSATGGVGQTVAVVDAFDDPNAASDLSFYRTTFGLPACGGGCFSKVNQTGGTTPPSPDSGWAQEISLDLDMVSAMCPLCHILLVEANSAALTDLGTAVNTAVSLGANVVSNSYGAPEYSSETSDSTTYYHHPGVAVVVSSGDKGYGVNFPAASADVTAVGGTSLNQSTNTGTRNATETAWSGAGSGCSSFVSKPSWQQDACSMRTVADVSAEADPNTPVWAYDSYGFGGWGFFGGTSAAAPIIGSMYALAGNPSSANTLASYPYGDVAALNDITSGSNGSCSGSYLCTAGPGYDGPTGLGTPSGTPAFSVLPSVTAVSPMAGPTGGGNTVSISGARFATGGGATTIKFGSLVATGVSCSSSTSCTATVPAGSAIADVTATTTASGTSPKVGADQYRYCSGLCAAASAFTWNGNAADNAITNGGANPNVFWQPTVTTVAPVAYEVDLSAPTTLSAVTSTWYAGFTPPSAYEIDTSSNGSTWTTQFATTTNASKSPTDVFPAGQVTASYLRLVITAFSPPCGGCGYAGLALVKLDWDGHGATFPHAYYPATLPNSPTANTTATWDNRVPDNVFSGGPGGTSWWQPVGVSGNTGTLVLAVDLGSPRTISTVHATWLNATFCPGRGLTCTGFNPINYTIRTSANGSQNSWTLCNPGVTGNASFTTTDACAAANVQYVEYEITTWNSATPFDGYGPAANSLTIS
jgi:hypothetical protein